MKYGFMDVDRYREYLDSGTELQVLVNGIDITNRCRSADDEKGFALVTLHDEHGEPYCNADGNLAEELLTGNVIIQKNNR